MSVVTSSWRDDYRECTLFNKLSVYLRHVTNNIKYVPAHTHNYSMCLLVCVCPEGLQLLTLHTYRPHERRQCGQSGLPPPTWIGSVIKLRSIADIISHGQLSTYTHIVSAHLREFRPWSLCQPRNKTCGSGCFCYNTRYGSAWMESLKIISVLRVRVSRVHAENREYFSFYHTWISSTVYLILHTQLLLRFVTILAIISMPVKFCG